MSENINPPPEAGKFGQARQAFGAALSPSGFHDKPRARLQPFDSTKKTQPPTEAKPIESTATGTPEAIKPLMARARETLEKAMAKGGQLYFDKNDPDGVKNLQIQAQAEAQKRIGAKAADETDDAYSKRLSELQVKVTEELITLENAVNSKLKLADETGMIKLGPDGKPLTTPENFSPTMVNALDITDPALAQEYQAARRMYMGKASLNRDEYATTMSEQLFETLKKTEPTLTKEALQKRLGEEFDQKAVYDAVEADKNVKVQETQTLAQKEKTEMDDLEANVLATRNFLEDPRNINNEKLQIREECRQALAPLRLSEFITTEFDRGGTGFRKKYMRAALMKSKKFVDGRFAALKITDEVKKEKLFPGYGNLKTSLEQPVQGEPIDEVRIKEAFQSHIKAAFNAEPNKVLPDAELDYLLKDENFADTATALFATSHPDVLKNDKLLRKVLSFSGVFKNNDKLRQTVTDNRTILKALAEALFGGEKKLAEVRRTLYENGQLRLLTEQMEPTGFLPMLQKNAGSMGSMFFFMIFGSVEKILGEGVEATPQQAGQPAMA